MLVDADGRIAASATHVGPGAESVVARGLLGSGAAVAAGLAVRNPSSDDARRAAATLTVDVKLPTQVVSTGSATALSEQWCGAARGARNVVAFTVGDYVHAGVLVEGRLLGGAHGAAGAAAWLALNPVEREDYRQLGCLEAEVGEAGIVRRLVWRIKAGDRSRVLEMAGGALTAITALHVLDAARQGDGVAISVVRDTAKYLGMALANLVAIVDPEIVVVGGIMADASDLLLEPSRVEMTRRVSAAAAQVPVVAMALGTTGAAVGAARAAMLASA